MGERRERCGEVTTSKRQGHQWKIRDEGIGKRKEGEEGRGSAVKRYKGERRERQEGERREARAEEGRGGRKR